MRTGVSQIQLNDLVPNHRCAEETQHLADRIRDRRATTAGEKKTNRARIRRHISTINDPESPLSRNLLPLFVTTIWPVNVLVKAVPPAHSLS